MNDRDQALIDFKVQLEILFMAVQVDDYQSQLIALNLAIGSLQDAKTATAQYCGGISN